MTLRYYLKKNLFEISKPITNKTLQFKNQHLNQSCYIFGDGVSLKWFDLEAFANKPSILLNKFILHKDANKLDLKYHFLIEPFFFLSLF